MSAGCHNWLTTNLSLKMTEPVSSSLCVVIDSTVGAALSPPAGSVPRPGGPPFTWLGHPQSGNQCQDR